MRQKPIVLVKLLLGDELVADRDEIFADGHALFLRVGKACDRGQKALACVSRDEIFKAEFFVGGRDGDAFVLSHKAVVDVKAQNPLLAQRLVQEREGYGRVNASA